MSSARYQLNVPWGLGDGAGTLSAGGSDIGLDMVATHMGNLLPEGQVFERREPGQDL